MTVENRNHIQSCMNETLQRHYRCRTLNIHNVYSIIFPRFTCIVSPCFFFFFILFLLILFSFLQHDIYTVQTQSQCKYRCVGWNLCASISIYGKKFRQTFHVLWKSIRWTMLSYIAVYNNNIIIIRRNTFTHFYMYAYTTNCSCFLPFIPSTELDIIQVLIQFFEEIFFFFFLFF